MTDSGRVLTGVPRRLARAWREGESDARMHTAGYRAWRDRLAGFGIAGLEGLDVLEVGCGDRAQLSLLCAAEGARVTGLDLRPVRLGLARPRMWLEQARTDGLRSGARTAVRDLVHTARYWRALSRFAGRPLPFSRVRIVRGDAGRLPFADDSFDLVISSAVWEHLPDVVAASREVSRVLRPDGLAIIQVALFPSLQGGHHPEWHSVDADPTRTIKPWDHLRPDRRPLPTYLNEWPEQAYRAALDAELRVVEWEDGVLRGEDYLDPGTEAELATYSRRDLLLSSITAWARKRDAEEGTSR